MFNRFAKDARTLVTTAHEAARHLGSPTVEAEHLLVACTAEARTDLAQLLDAAGLDRAGVDRAIEAESDRSLASVGISAHAFDLPAPTVAAAQPRFAASAKLALERSLKIASARGDHRIESAHILLGVLDARHGTVPRALELAGIDRGELSRRVEEEALAAR